MSSTEQKNVTQPFIAHCFTYGILPTIRTKAFDGFALDTDRLPFTELGPTPDLGARLRSSPNPVEEAKLLLPVLCNAKSVTRLSPFLLGLCDKSHVYYGNQAVLRFAEGILTDRWRARFAETHAIKHAGRHATKICSILAPAGYGNISRTAANVRRIEHKTDSYRLRLAADSVDYFSRGAKGGKYPLAVRRWCNKARIATGLRTSYVKSADATAAVNGIDIDTIRSVGPLPEYPYRAVTCPKRGNYAITIQRLGSHTYVRVTDKQAAARDRATVARIGDGGSSRIRGYITSDLFCFSNRDLDDLRFLLQSGSAIKSYHRRRAYDIPKGEQRRRFNDLTYNMWVHYLAVMRYCGSSFFLRNKLGVYFDVLQWRYLANKSGDEFYNHSHIMAQKIKGKDLVPLPPQEPILNMLNRVSMDVAVDLLGMYKASIYPEVDPFRVVTEQMELHFSRHNTDWEDGSPERCRFDQTRNYMWYLGVRVLHNKYNIWPGRIRAGVEEKDWHRRYKSHGIPGDKWEDAHDVDLTGSVPVVGISNEQYLKQQDSACAPPLQQEFKSAEMMRKAPKRHKRKLLYAVQESILPSLPESVQHLNQIGSLLPDGYVGSVEHSLPFSVDIVTGSRCERHKESPRPFYAASPPWGCILSYFDGITRDFLSNVPQSMLGKSTRQKYLDISSTARGESLSADTFYMSDDKAKYSPKMDPQSQQLPADFFAELFNIPAIKACGPIMYHNRLFYRVCGHLVNYSSNGTDREGMRGAANTWLEIVAQGLATRLARDKGLIVGKSVFLSFIDDGLRKFSIASRDRTQSEVRTAARAVIDEVIFGLKVLGRELSWDKTFISRNMFVILNELMYDGAHFSSGLKSFVTAGDIELKPVMSANDYEQIYFGKMRGAHTVGAPLDLCHYTYVYETLLGHFKLGVNLQDNHLVGNLEYRLFCITPYGLGGGGIRSLGQLGSNEIANATKEGIGSLVRLGKNVDLLEYCVGQIIRQPLEELNPVDFMREPEQIHVAGPRLKSQRLAAEVRKRLRNIAGNDMSRQYIERDKSGLELLEKTGRALMRTQDVSAEDVRELYATTPVAFIDEFIQKLASSTTLSEILDQGALSGVRKAVRRDLIQSVYYFRIRCDFSTLFMGIRGDALLLGSLLELLN